VLRLGATVGDAGFTTLKRSAQDALVSKKICVDQKTCQDVCESSFSPYSNKLFDQLIAFKDPS
jgi:hypothetical protein